MTSTATQTYTRKTLPAAHYAIIWPGNGKTYFFRVQVGKSGKWAGTRFITRQSSDDYLPIRPEGRDAAYSLILADPIGAMALYGQRIERCGRCRKTLTDEDSRAFGIGPDCRKILGI